MRGALFILSAGICLLWPLAPGASGITLPGDALPAGKVGQVYAGATITVSGQSGATYMSLAFGALPAGLSLDGATGVISGTPTVAGAASFRISVVDETSASAAQDFSITVSAADLAFVTGALSPGVRSASYRQVLAATGGQAPYGFSLLSGSLPAGLSLASDGTISGSPSSLGGATATIRVSDAASANVDAVFTLEVIDALLTITTASLPKALAGAAYTTMVAVTGGQTPYTFSLSSGALPSGLALDAATGAITGTPSAAESVTFTASVTGSAATPQRTAATFTLVVAAATPVLATTSLPGATVGEPYSQTLSALGATSPSWSLSAGTLPTGISLNAATGALSGTPVASGAHALTFALSDTGTGRFDAASLTLPVAEPTIRVELTLVDDAGNGLSPATASFAFSLSGARTPTQTSGSTAQFALDPANAGETCTITLPGYLQTTTTTLGYNPGPVRLAAALTPNLSITVNDELGNPLSAAQASFTFSQSGALTPLDLSGNVARFAFTGAAGQTAAVALSGMVSAAGTVITASTSSAQAVTVPLRYSTVILGATDSAGAALDVTKGYVSAAAISVARTLRVAGKVYVGASAGSGLLSLSLPGYGTQTVSLSPTTTAQQSVDFDHDPVLDYGATVDGAPIPDAVTGNEEVVLVLRDELGGDLINADATFTFSQSGVRTATSTDGPLVKFDFASLADSGETCTVSVPGYVSVSTAALNYASAGGAQAVLSLPFAALVSAVGDESGAALDLNAVSFSATGMTLSRQVISGGACYLAISGGPGTLLAVSTGYAVAGTALTVKSGAQTTVAFTSGAPGAGVVDAPPLLFALRLSLQDEQGQALAALDGAFRFSQTGLVSPRSQSGGGLLFKLANNPGETVTVSLPGYLDTVSAALFYGTAQVTSTLTLPTTVVVKPVEDERGAALSVALSEIASAGFAVRSSFTKNGAMHFAATPLPGTLTVAKTGFFAEVATITPSATSRAVIAFDEGPVDAEVTRDFPGLKYALAVTMHDQFARAMPVAPSALRFSFSGAGLVTPTVHENGADKAYFADTTLGGQTLSVTSAGFLDAQPVTLGAGSAPLAASVTLGYSVVVLGATDADGAAITDLSTLAVSAQRLLVTADFVNAAARYLAVTPPVQGTDGLLGVSRIVGTGTHSSAVTITPTTIAAITVDFDLGTPGAFAATIDGPEVKAGGQDAFAAQITAFDEVGAPRTLPAGTTYTFANSGTVAPVLTLENKASFSLDARNSPEAVTINAPGFIPVTTSPIDHAAGQGETSITLRFRAALALTTELGTALSSLPEGTVFSFGGETLAVGRQNGNTYEFAWTGATDVAPTAALPGFITKTAAAMLNAAATQTSTLSLALQPSIKIVAATAPDGQSAVVFPSSAPFARARGENGLAVTYQESGQNAHFVACGAGSGTLRLSVPGEAAGLPGTALFGRVAVSPTTTAQQTVRFGGAATAEIAGDALGSLSCELFDDDRNGMLDRARLEFGAAVDIGSVDLGQFRLNGVKPTDKQIESASPEVLDLIFANPQIPGTIARDLLYTGGKLKLEWDNALPTTHAVWDAAGLTEKDRAAPAVIALASADRTGNGPPDRVVVTFSEAIDETGIERADWQFVDQAGFDLLAGTNPADFIVSGAELIITTRDRSGVPGLVRYRYLNRGDPLVRLRDRQSPANNATTLGDINNSAPIADAGPDWAVLSGETAPLSGRRCRDPDGFADLAAFRWAEHAENPQRLLLNGAASQEARDVVVTPLAPGRYRFMLTATDAGGLSGLDEVEVLVLDIATAPPWIDALPSRVDALGDEGFVALDLEGPLTRDADGGAGLLTMSWQALETPLNAVFDLSDGNNARFETPGRYRLRATLSDTDDDALPARAEDREILVLDRRSGAIPREAPGSRLELRFEREADAPGPLKGTTIVLDASQSAAIGGKELRFLWQQREGPQTLLTGAESQARLTVTPSIAGRYRFAVRVDDGVGTGSWDERDVLVIDAPPRFGAVPRAFSVVQPGPIALHPGIEAPLEARVEMIGASSPNFAVEWHQIEGPPAPLRDAATLSPRFLPLLSGVYRFEATLWIDDQSPWTQSVEVPITLLGTGASPPEAPLFEELPPQTFGAPITVRIRDAGALGYRWEQVEGPPLLLESRAGPSLTLRPTAPARYRLRVRAESDQALSAPRELAVEVLPAPPPPPVIPVHIKSAGCFNSAPQSVWAGWWLVIGVVIGFGARRVPARASR